MCKYSQRTFTWKRICIECEWRRSIRHWSYLKCKCFVLAFASEFTFHVASTMLRSNRVILPLCLYALWNCLLRSYFLIQAQQCSRRWVMSNSDEFLGNSVNAWPQICLTCVPSSKKCSTWQWWSNFYWALLASKAFPSINGKWTNRIDKAAARVRQISSLTCRNSANVYLNIAQLVILAFQRKWMRYIYTAI